MSTRGHRRRLCRGGRFHAPTFNVAVRKTDLLDLVVFSSHYISISIRKWIKLEGGKWGDNRLVRNDTSRGRNESILFLLNTLIAFSSNGCNKKIGCK